ncbi:MAG: NAD-dependent epimerase/dehydratase family protein [Verrucomicrobia bacterium]|nr:NAD-dependent epimerase/dehydratase family protein [Verrucomicrobiota bacterium]
MSFWNNKRVLVTGGGGFLGTHVVEALAKRGVTNAFVVRQKEYNIAAESEVIRLFKDHPADIVIHLAGLVGGILPNKEKPADYFYQNLMMGTLMHHYSWRNGVQKFIAAGAGCGYPESAPNPLKETSFWDGFPQKESAPYSLAKRLLSVQSEAYFRQHGFVSVIVIPGNIYGPYDNYHLLDAHVIPALVRKFVEATQNNAPSVEVWGTGKAARDFVYAGDVAEGLLLAAETQSAYDLINLSSGKETSVLEVVEMLKKVTGFKGEIAWNTNRPDGQMHRRFDISKAKATLGWEARTNLEAGLRITADWYRQHQAGARK